MESHCQIKVIHGANQTVGWERAARVDEHVTGYLEPRLATHQGLIYQNHIKTHANGAFERLSMQQKRKDHEGFSPRTAILRGWEAREAGDRWSLWYSSAVCQRQTRPRVVSLSAQGVLAVNNKVVREIVAFPLDRVEWGMISWRRKLRDQTEDSFRKRYGNKHQGDGGLPFGNINRDLEPRQTYFATIILSSLLFFTTLHPES
jgi:hypothetical protein